MNDYSNTNDVRRVNKAQAKRIYNNNGILELIPCKMAYRNPWQTPILVRKSDMENRDFDKLVNEFEFYNCNSQTGYYTAFYTPVL